MIYTIGYQHITPTELARIMKLVGATKLIDCRYRPQSRIQGFNRNQLADKFGDQYITAGERLGGMGHTSAAGLAWLAGLEKQNPMIMCLEAAPGDCHRHSAIAVPLFKKHKVDCTHIYEDTLVMASELDAAITEERDYEYTDIVGF